MKPLHTLLSAVLTTAGLAGAASAQAPSQGGYPPPGYGYQGQMPSPGYGNPGQIASPGYGYPGQMPPPDTATPDRCRILPAMPDPVACRLSIWAAECQLEARRRRWPQRKQNTAGIRCSRTYLPKRVPATARAMTAIKATAAAFSAKASRRPRRLPQWAAPWPSRTISLFEARAIGSNRKQS